MVLWEKFTERAREAIARAQEYASKGKHQQLDVEHLLLALLEPEDGIAASILEKLGAKREKIMDSLREELKQLPKVYGTGVEVYASPRVREVFDLASAEVENFKDEFVSVEH